MRNIFFTLLASLLVATSAFGADTVMNPPKPDAKGSISTKEYVDFLTHDMKPKVFGDDKVLACYKLKRDDAFEKKYSAVAKSCKTKLLKDVPPRIRGPFEMKRIEGPFGSCLEVTMRDKQKLTPRQLYECIHGPTG